MSAFAGRMAVGKIWFGILLLMMLIALSASVVVADPTWPSHTDELEEIMYQLKAFRGRRFSESVAHHHVLIMLLMPSQYRRPLHKRGVRTRSAECG